MTWFQARIANDWGWATACCRGSQHRALEPQQLLLALEAAGVADERCRSTPTTRWHGRTIGIGFRFITVPTARAARRASGTSRRARRTSSSARTGRARARRARSGRTPAGRARSTGEVERATRPSKYSSSSRPAVVDGARDAEDARAERRARSAPERVGLGPVEGDPAEPAVGRGDEQRRRRASRQRRRRRRASPSAVGGVAEARSRSAGTVMRSSFAAAGRRTRRPGGPRPRTSRARRRSAA